MAVIKYSFRPQELNNLKAYITGRLIRRYINDVLIPRLKREEKWDQIVYIRAWFTAENMERLLPLDRNMELFILVSMNFFRTPSFLMRFRKLTRLLDNVPDGFIIKMRNTGKNIKYQDAVKCIYPLSPKLVFTWKISTDYRTYIIRRSNYEANISIPIVDGDIEVVEVKSGKSKFSPNQVKSYNKILKNNYILRYYHVNIISFKDNKFEIFEKVIKK